MRIVWSVVTTLLAAATLTLAAAPAFAQSCQALRVERNSYYKAHGYCFKTQRAIRYFGNGGCYIHDEAAVPLAPGSARASRRSGGWSGASAAVET